MVVRLESADIYKSKKVIGILLLIALCISFFLWATKAEASAITQVAWFPDNSRGVAGAYFPNNNSIYTNNGWGTANQNDIWRFPLSSYVFAHTGWLMGETYQLAFASSGRIGDYIFWLGGGNLSGQSASIYRYSPTDNVLTAVGSLPHPLLMAATATYNNAIYMAGGTDKYSQGNFYDHVWKWDGSTLTTVGNLPTVIWDAAAEFDADGKMIIFGGRTQEGPDGPTSAILKFDPLTSQTTTIGNLPRACSGLSAARVDDSIYLFIPTATDDPNDITEIYQFKNEQLYKLSEYLPYRLMWTCAIAAGDKIYIFCGRDPETTTDYMTVFCLDTTKIAPGKPAVSVSVDNNNVTLTWEPVNNGYSYHVERSDNGTTWTEVGNTSNTTYTIQESPGTHYYRVRAESEGGTYGPYSDVVSTTIALPAPSNLTATVQNRTVTLTWQPVSEAQSYIVQRSTDGQNWTTIAETTDNNYTDNNTNYNTTYYYRVLSKKGELLSEPSTTVQVTTGNIEKPSDLQVISLKDNQVSLSWNPAPGVSNYRIERSMDGQNWVTVGNSQTNTFTDNTLQPDQTYYYRVRSEDGGSVSEPSNTVALHTNPATPPPPQVVSGLTAIWEGNKIKVNWDRGQNEIPNSSMYQLFRQNADGSWVPVKTVSAAEKDSFTFYDANVLGGINYKYELRALGDFTTGFEWQTFAESGWATGNRPLVAPGGMRVSGNVLNWEAVEGASGYKVSYSIDGGVTWQTTTVQGTSATLPSGSLAKVQAAGNENSDWSGVVRIP